MRDHDVTMLTARELERAKRELQANLALARPGSPARVPIQAHLSAIDAELSKRSRRHGGQEQSVTYRCSCGFSTASLGWFEDHLFTFPEDDHYELASGHHRWPTV
jgi:hypothetical protein